MGFWVFDDQGVRKEHRRITSPAEKIARWDFAQNTRFLETKVPPLMKEEIVLPSRAIARSALLLHEHHNAFRWRCFAHKPRRNALERNRIPANLR